MQRWLHHADHPELERLAKSTSIPYAHVLHVCRSPYVLCNCDYTLLPSSEDVSCPQWISAVMDESVLHCDLNDSIGHGAGVACRGHVEVVEVTRQNSPPHARLQLTNVIWEMLQCRPDCILV